MKLTNQSRLGAGLADEIIAAYDMMVATPRTSIIIPGSC